MKYVIDAFAIIGVIATLGAVLIGPRGAKMVLAYIVLGFAGGV